MLPKLTVKTASSDHAPTISKSFVAPVVVNGNMAAAAAADQRSQSTAVVTVQSSPRAPGRLPPPPSASAAATSTATPGWNDVVSSATANSPRRRRPRRAPADPHSVPDAAGPDQTTPSLSLAATNWLRLIEKLGDTQFGDVRSKAFLTEFVALHNYASLLTHSRRPNTSCCILSWKSCFC